jgi:thiaminase/transcriptional activator TenA
VTFTDELWASTESIRERIDGLPFLVALEDGSLPRERFDHYLAQDARYLIEFGRVLAHAAAVSPTADALVFWAESAVSTVRVERELHARHVGDLDGAPMSPTCSAYTSYLLSVCAAGSYPVLTAAVLPCFWIYDDVGVRLKQRLGETADHPYGDWVATYGDPAFTAATERARALVDAAAQRAGAEDLAGMRAAFTTAARFEYLFWDAAWRLEEWTV